MKKIEAEKDSRLNENNFYCPENISPQMMTRFKVLDELIAGGYIHKTKPINELLPTICFIPSITSKFNEAPQELRKHYRRFFSWYAFFFAPYSFTQTRMGKDYFIILTGVLVLVYLIPESWTPIIRGMGTAFSFFISQVFVFSRYHQYQEFGRCPPSRSLFSTIALGSIGLFCSILLGAFIITLMSMLISYPKL